MNDTEAGQQEPKKVDRNSPRMFAQPIRKLKNYFQDRRAKNKQKSPSDRAAESTARATWAIATLTFVTIGVGVSQYVIFDRQLREMQNPFSFTAESNRINRDAFISTNHATIIPLGPKITSGKSADGNNVWEIRTEWKNIGHTSTLGLKVSTLCQVVGSNDPVPNEFDPSVGSHSKLMTIVADQTTALGDKCSVPPATLRKVQTGDSRLYFVARADYKDAFNSPYEYVTKYCVALTSIDGDVMNLSMAPTAQSEPCESDNCVDEDCKKRP